MSGPVPARADGTAKAALLGLIDGAVDAGWSFSRACAVLELDRGRAWRWQQRRAADRLDDARPGGNPIHGLLEWEEAEILALFDEWADVDRSHRKLAHRGSYEQRVGVTVNGGSGAGPSRPCPARSSPPGTHGEDAVAGVV